MEIKNNYSLKEKNTFALDAKAKLFAAPKSIDGLKKLLQNEELKKEALFVLGGGSNVLFLNDFDGLVIQPLLFGKEIVAQDESHVLVQAKAAEDWDGFVEWTVNQGFGGLENLSLIPGSVGACPVQNIGAYGVEAGDVIEKVEAIEIETGKLHSFKKEECEFAYRNSIFKNRLKGKYIITSVYFSLSKKPAFKINYGAVKQELEKMGGLSLQSVRQAVINIRKSKLPEPEECPNAGSFFKNPMVSKDHLEQLQIKFPDIVSYKVDESNYKLAAGWMIDKLGWKGESHGSAAVHDKQALVLVNKNNASGAEIIELAKKIQQSVVDTFNVELEMEVNVV